MNSKVNDSFHCQSIFIINSGCLGDEMTRVIWTMIKDKVFDFSTLTFLM